MSCKPAPQKRRNNEKRKEKSRVAARCRRTKEMQIFAELTAALPAKKEEVEQLDKASVMRLAIAYLRVRDVVTLLPDVTSKQPQQKIPETLEDVATELSCMKALDGFVLVISQPGDMVYCSENISDHLGVNQMEVMGQSVFEFSHPCDHDEMREALRYNGVGAARRDLLLRLKCTLTGKGRNVHLKSASYKVIHVTGHILMPSKPPKSEEKSAEDSKPTSGMLVAVGRPIPHPSNIEIPLDSKTFLTKHSLDMKFTYIDDTLFSTLGYKSEDLVGKSLFDYHHASDAASLTHQFKSLFSKGQCETGQYRFLAKTGGFAWIQTQATLITDKQQKPLSVVCVNYIVSGIECKDEVFTVHQLQHAELKPKLLAPNPVHSYNLPNGAIVGPVVLPEEERPIPVTESIFAPRKEGMNKGFLMFSQDEGLPMLKDEPDDLTHLAPTAGDTCIPLESSPFDMFDDFILSDNYCSLLTDDLANGSPVDSLGTDPLLMSSPDTQGSDSSCEQGSLLTEISLETFDSRTSEGEFDDGKSPFIPLIDEQPELLEPAVMWGALPDNVSLARPQPPEPQTTPAPALQRLLAAAPTGPQPQDLITNIYSDQGLIPSRGVTTWDSGVKRIMKQEEEPSAKRSKRSISPPQGSPASQSSSVLMNLLDLPQPPPQHPKIDPNLIGPNYQLVTNCRKLNPRDPITALNGTINGPLTNPIQNIPVQKLIRLKPDMAATIRNNQMPLTLNVNPYPQNKPYSPDISPLISPVQKDRQLISPNITPKLLSPISGYGYSPGANKIQPLALQSTNDPYLTNKLPSPNYQLLQKDILIEQDVSLSSPDFWNEGEMIQDTNDLLAALNYVNLN